MYSGGVPSKSDVTVVPSCSSVKAVVAVMKCNGNINEHNKLNQLIVTTYTCDRAPGPDLCSDIVGMLHWLVQKLSPYGGPNSI